MPFLDLAYQGLGEGLEADARTVDLFARSMSPVFVSSSFSKSFSLYGERIGALSVVTADADETARVLSQLKRLVRANTPLRPRMADARGHRAHDTRVASDVGERPGRDARADQVRAQGFRRQDSQPGPGCFSFVLRQRGMFSFGSSSISGGAPAAEEYSISSIETGRICVAALNSNILTTFRTRSPWF